MLIFISLFAIIMRSMLEIVLLIMFLFTINFITNINLIIIFLIVISYSYLTIKLTIFNWDRFR